ncbi:MAG TPA: hypothetical protein VHR18_07925 [Solirubrobacterales bacterium]|jgi:hypothetical protein|nr:hypothetical protein [Solirubrobacterales bacterium]
MTKATKRTVLVPMLAIAAIAAGFAGEAVAAKAGPVVASCGKLKTQAQKQRCAKENAANRVAFNQIKDSKFVGERGDGEYLEDTYCANGKYESRSSGSYGTGVSTGKIWKVDNAIVKQGGKWINAFVLGPDGFEIGIQRRGPIWKIGIARSDSSIEDPGVMEKAKATAECATLEV